MTKKNKVVVDIRELNRLIKFNVYSILFQDNIIIFIRDYVYIIVINVISFFY